MTGYPDMATTLSLVIARHPISSGIPLPVPTVPDVHVIIPLPVTIDPDSFGARPGWFDLRLSWWRRFGDDHRTSTAVSVKCYQRDHPEYEQCFSHIFPFHIHYRPIICDVHIEDHRTCGKCDAAFISKHFCEVTYADSCVMAVDMAHGMYPSHINDGRFRRILHYNRVERVRS